MNIYVMRHGTTVWNEKGIIQGRSHNRLSKNGKILVKEVSKKHKNTKFNIIFSSPLMRTMQTANIMNQYHKVKIIKDDRLIEINQGIFTGRKKNSFTEKERQLRAVRDESCGMEKYQSVYLRVKDFLNELISSRNVLIITHNVNATFIANILSGNKVDFENWNHTHNFDNAEIRCFEI